MIENARYLVQAAEHQEDLTLAIQEGNYRAEWVDPATGRILHTYDFSHGGGNCTFRTPEYSIDIALRIKSI